MRQVNFSTEERKHFLKRGFSDQLDGNLLSARAGSQRSMALLGSSGSGKNAILLEHLSRITEPNIISAYLDFEKISMTPEQFPISFISSICSAVFKQDIFSLEQLLRLKLGLESSALLKNIHNELQKIKPDQTVLLDAAFSFPHTLAIELGKKIEIGIREFYELLTLNNFSQVQDVMALFLRHTSKNVWYIITSRHVYLLQKHLSDFQVLYVEPLNPAETKRFVEMHGIKKADSDFLHKLTGGHLTYLAVLFRHMQEGKNPAESFVREALTIGGTINTLCRLKLADKLSHARGDALLKSILFVLAQEPRLRLCEVASRIYRSAPITKSLLERLMAVDLLIKQDNRFRIADPVLSYVIAKTHRGFEYAVFPKEELDGLVREVAP